jgi:hypothetical protein
LTIVGLYGKKEIEFKSHEGLKEGQQTQKAFAAFLFAAGKDNPWYTSPNEMLSFVHFISRYIILSFIIKRRIKYVS